MNKVNTVILGSGVSGLAAGYYMLQKCGSKSFIILESTKRSGGWIKSTIQSNGTIFEQGPRTIRPRGEPGANTLQLIEELGLSNEITPVPSNHPAALNRMIYANNELHTLPSTISSMFTKQSPFSKSLIAHLAHDIFAKSVPAKNNDESIYDFANRRFGVEVADYLISPIICGICGGNAKEISVKFLMQSLFEKEQTYGSISKGLVRELFKRANINFHKSRLYQKAMTERWSVYSFNNGIETLTKTLEKHIVSNGGEIQFNNTCHSIEFKPDQIILNTDKGEISAEHLISSIPADKLSDLTSKNNPDLSKLLKIKSASLAVVNLEYPKKLIDKEGFGFLISPKENLPILGVIYDSCCFPRENRTILTVMMGGHWFEQNFGLNPDEDTLYRIAIDQIKKILNINETPSAFKVNILRNSIPQYIVGHQKRVADINNYISQNKLPLSLCGASYNGVGVNDVILSAKRAVKNLT